MKRVLTIQDISCLGKCSLTAVIPVLSAMELEPVILPTTILSAHTEFKSPYIKDLTEIMEPVAAHWKSQGIVFDSLSCGYLGSIGQMAIVKKIFEDFKRPGVLTVIDPAMGDYGRLYEGFDMDYVEEMRRFCSVADVLLPNLTEAAYLLGMTYEELPQDRAGFDILIKELAELNHGIVVLKGIRLTKGKEAVLAYDSQTEETVFYEREHLNAKLSGTGDIFTAVCQGAFTKGMKLAQAVELAMDFVLECMKKTVADENHRWYGVNLEEALPLLYKRNAAVRMEDK